MGNKLSTKALRSDTRLLLQSICNKDYLQGYRLVGGTALAMYLQHRESIDLDLFSESEPKIEELKIFLAKDFSFEILNTTRVSLNALINNVKVDFIYHPYPTLAPAIPYQNLEVASLPDICAMKLNAAVGRGSKKDFIDIYFLLQTYSLKQMLNWYLQKYPNTNEVMVLKSLSFFANADEQLMPRMTKPLLWQEVKTTLNKTLKTYINTL